MSKSKDSKEDPAKVVIGKHRGNFSGFINQKLVRARAAISINFPTFMQGLANKESAYETHDENYYNEKIAEKQNVINSIIVANDGQKKGYCRKFIAVAVE